MDPRDFNHARLAHLPAEAHEVALPESYRVEIRLTVTDASALWQAAAAKALTAHGMSLDDVVDTLGPSADPSVEDCLAMLTAPEALAGCTLGDFVIDRDQPLIVPTALAA